MLDSTQGGELVLCTHCGSHHPRGAVLCLRTGEPMSSRGLVGTQLDRYQLEALIGTGGFGGVYRARHVHTDQVVAIKVLKKQLAHEKIMLDRLFREAKAAAAAGSEHIVRILDAGIANDGLGFLVMEFLEGCDLKQLIARDGPPSTERIVDIACQVLSALQAAHAKKIVHRDVKPANVFLINRGEELQVKLLDFGISRMREEEELTTLTMPGIVMGTPSYMAAEQFEDAHSVDGRADLYSVAVMLYEVLARRRPFHAPSYPELWTRVQREAPPPLLSVAPGVDPKLAAIVDKGLAKDVGERWQSAEEFRRALRDACGGSDRPWSEPAPPSVVAPPSPGSERNRSLFGTADDLSDDKEPSLAVHLTEDTGVRRGPQPSPAGEPTRSDLPAAAPPPAPVAPPSLPQSAAPSSNAPDFADAMWAPNGPELSISGRLREIERPVPRPTDAAPPPAEPLELELRRPKVHTVAEAPPPPEVTATRVRPQLPNAAVGVIAAGILIVLGVFAARYAVREVPEARRILPEKVVQALDTKHIFIDSIPSGAKVFINDRYVADTPWATDNLYAGTVRYRLELAPYEPHEGTFAGGDEVTQTVRLARGRR